jgi:hypothetical protein
MTGPRDSAGRVPVLPPSGPLAGWPDVTAGQARAMLDTALSGLALGPVDRDARDRLTGPDPVGPDPVGPGPAVVAAVVAGWIRRGFEAGLSAGRAELVDEVAVVQAARAEALALARKLTTAEVTLARVSGWWRDATGERDEARDDLEQVVAGIAAAAAEAGLVVDDDTADLRVALRMLLRRLEQVAGPLTEDGRR